MKNANETSCRQEELKHEIITVKGMQCRSCEEIIERSVGDLGGVVKIKASFPEEKAYICFDPKLTDLGRIRKEIEKWGYKCVGTGPAYLKGNADKNAEAGNMAGENKMHGIEEKEIEEKFRKLKQKYAQNLGALKQSHTPENMREIEVLKQKYTQELEALLRQAEQTKKTEAEGRNGEADEAERHKEQEPAADADNEQNEVPPKKTKPNCCESSNANESGVKTGLIYGLLPHTGCIAFLVFTVLGVTAAASAFAPLVANSAFFYGLILMSFIFTTVSAMIYLVRRKLLTFAGIQKKWRYLATMYGTTMAVNLLLVFVVFPAVAGAGSNYSGSSLTGASINTIGGVSKLTLQVAIPCAGHAPLITGELKKVSGVSSVSFKSPNVFEIGYSPASVKDTILSLAIFKEYPATVLSDKQADTANLIGSSTPPSGQAPSAGGCSMGSGCGGGCGMK